MTLRELIDRRYKEKQRVMQEEMADGGAKDYAHYRYMVGYLKGMFDFHEEVERYLKNMEQEEDE